MSEFDEIVGALDEDFGDDIAIGDDGFDVAIGAEEIVGGAAQPDGVEDFVEQLMVASGAGLAPGGVVPGVSRQMARLAKGMRTAKEIDPEAVALVRRRPNQRRRYPLGFSRAKPVKAGGNGILRAHPQQIFRGERLFVPSNIAPFFLITDIKIGTKGQMVSDDGVHAMVFSEVSENANVTLDTATVGNSISIHYENIDDEERTFSATLFGTVVQ
jgi:hypothetical protein